MLLTRWSFIILADFSVSKERVVPEPRYRRRKEDRPQEIIAAAFAAFAENGYTATRVDEVAKRAGVSKGLMYLYFKTKDELFKAVVRNVVVRRVDALIADVEETELSSEDYLRGPRQRTTAHRARTDDAGDDLEAAVRKALAGHRQTYGNTDRHDHYVYQGVSGVTEC